MNVITSVKLKDNYRVYLKYIRGDRKELPVKEFYNLKDQISPENEEKLISRTHVYIFNTNEFYC